MKLFNLEAGFSKLASGRLYWTWFEFTPCYAGCSIYNVGPFYFTVLRGECK